MVVLHGLVMAVGINEIVISTETMWGAGFLIAISGICIGFWLQIGFVSRAEIRSKW